MFPSIPIARQAVYSVFMLLALDGRLDPSEYLSDIAKPSFEAGRSGCSAAVDRLNAENRVTVENAFKRFPTAATQKSAPYQVYPRPKFSRPVFIARWMVL